MATKEKSQDEKNLKFLRELASLPSNKYCFDCQQRGPTYINVTNGSFVCTSCSGILRGLNPPHRVKSITMASFTQEEMELIKSRGNEYCKHVWLGKYDPQVSAESEYQNIQKIRDFMIQKYEEKRYYVEPEIAVKKMKARAPSAPINSVSQSKSQSSIQTKSSPQIQRPGWMSQDFTDSKGDAKVTDVFKSESSELFKSWPKAGDVAEPTSFADFSQAFGSTATPTTLTSQALTSSSQMGSFTSTTSSPVAISNQTVTSSKPSQKKPAPPPPDRYAPLADLDNQMHTLQSQTVPVNPAPVAATAAMTTNLPFWSTSAVSAYGSAPMTNPSILATDAKNPFGHTTSTWSQQNLISSANPFQTIPQQRTNPLGNPVVPVQHPVTNGLPNPSVTSQQSMKNGSVVPSIWPPVSSNGWNTSPFPNGQVDPLQNKTALTTDHYNPWAQALAPGVINPFVNGSGSTGVPVAMPRTNAGNNPFL